MGFGREVEEGGRDLLCMEACRLQEGLTVSLHSTESHRRVFSRGWHDSNYIH